MPALKGLTEQVPKHFGLSVHWYFEMKDKMSIKLKVEGPSQTFSLRERVA